MTRALILVALTIVPASARADDWPQFRGPGGSGVSAEKNLPTRWAPDENLRWKADLPGRGVSCPVVVGDRVYVTCCSGPNQTRLHVLALDPKTGKQLWARRLWATGGTVCHTMTNMAAPTPAADATAVYALFATGDLAAFGRDGDLLWYRSLVGDYPTVTNQVGAAASPVLVKDTLIVPMENSGDSFLAGLDTKDGRNRWKVARDREVNWVTPLVRKAGGADEVVMCCRESLTAYDPATGKTRWTYQARGLGTIPSPVQDGGRLFVPGGELHCIQPVEGQAEPVVLWKSAKLGTDMPSPLVHEGKVYALKPGLLTCGDATNGEELWRVRLTGKHSGASPVLAGGHLYVVNDAGVTTVFQLGGAKPLEVARNDLKEEMLATPAVAGGAIYLRSDAHLFCVAETK